MEQEIEIEADQVVTQDFQLYQDLIGLDEVMVTGVVLRVQIGGEGRLEDGKIG